MTVAPSIDVTPDVTPGGRRQADPPFVTSGVTGAGARGLMTSVLLRRK